MRNLRNPQLERGEVRIEDIKLNHKSRDDMPVLLGVSGCLSATFKSSRMFLSIISDVRDGAYITSQIESS